MKTEEIQTRILSGIKTEEKPRPVPRRRAIRDAKIDVLREALARARNHRRNVPKDWHIGYDSALSQIGILLDEIAG